MCIRDRRKADRPADDYLAPKAERDAEWGTPIVPPFGPMLAKLVKEFPKAVVLFEPKWDGCRTLIWRSGGRVELGSRNSKPVSYTHLDVYKRQEQGRASAQCGIASE